jgi:ABC-type transport system substrate-binding protein
MGTAGLNIANFSDTVVDNLIEKGRTTTDQSIRLDMYAQFQEVWDEVQPSVVIAYPHYTYLLRDNVEASIPDVFSDPCQRFVDIYLWKV